MATDQAIEHEMIRLRREAGTSRSLHRRALKRLKEQRAKHREKMASLKATQEAREAALKREILQLKLQVKKLQDLHFGRSSEGGRSFSGDLSKKAGNREKRPRGQRRGGKGHGRRPHSELPVTDEVHQPSEDQLTCPACGLPSESTGLEDVSEEVEFEVRLFRRRHHRPRYRAGCSCDASRPWVCAPVPARAFDRSKYSDSFWIEILLLKYEYQMPLTRIAGMLGGHGASSIAPGTLCGGVERGADMLRPLHAAIMARDQAASLRHMDETGLKVFVEVEGRRSRLWCLWQSSTADTCVFRLSPKHNGDIPEAYLEESPEDGVVCVDRHRAYSNLKQILSYCRAHVRRDFVKLGRGERRSLGWAIEAPAKPFEAWASRP